MKKVAAVFLAVIISCFSAGGSFILAEDTAYTAVPPVSSAGIPPASSDGIQPETSDQNPPASQIVPPTPQTVVQPAPTVAVQFAKPISIKYSRSGIYEVVQITAKGYTDYNSFELKDPRRIVVDLKNTKAPAKQAVVKTGGPYVKLVRYANYKDGTSRVVLELNEGFEYSAEPGDNGITVYVSRKQSQEMLDKTKAISIGKNYSVRLNTVNSKDALTVSLKNLEGYRISRYTGPDRLVLTVPDAGAFGSDRVSNVNMSQVGSISYKKTGKAGAIIIIVLKGQFQYEAAESEGQLVLTFHWPNYTNIYYNNNNDRVYLTLRDTKLTEGAKYLKPLYKEEYDEARNRYIITFPTALSAIREGKLDINDAYLKDFEVRLNPEDGTTSIIFTGNGKNAYLVFTRESGLTAITVMKPAANGRKLVVIDAGHGGDATGTITGPQRRRT